MASLATVPTSPAILEFTSWSKNIMAKVKIALSRLSIPAKIQKLRQIITAMTGNANFTTPSPTLASITTLINDLETKFNTAQTARTTAQQMTDLQDLAEKALDAAMTLLVSYAENVTGGDGAKLQSGGFDLRDPSAPIGDLPAPANLIATIGDNDGEIDLDWDSVRGAGSYVVERSADPPTATSWQMIKTFKPSKGTISGLTSGTKNWFRVAAVGTAGQSPWSDPATKIAP